MSEEQTVSKADVGQLTRFDPKNAIAAFEQTEEDLKALAERNSKLVFDVSTTKGLDEAKKARAELREPRVAIEKARVNGKADALAYGKAVDAQAKKLTAIIEPVETSIDAQIKKQEALKEEIRLAKERAEAAKIKAENDALDNLRNIPLAALSMSAEGLASVIDRTKAMNLVELFDNEAARERGAALRESALLHLATMHASAVALEEKTAREADERRKEAEAAAERKRRDDEQRELDEAADKKRREEERAEEDAKAAARRKELDDEAARQREAAAELQRKADELAKKEADAARERADREAKEKREADEKAHAARIAKIKAEAGSLLDCAINALALLASKGLASDPIAIQLTHAIERERSAKPGLTLETGGRRAGKTTRAKKAGKA